MSATAELLGNRRWTVNANGVITSLTRRYQIVRDSLPAGTSADEVATFAGLPSLRSAHTAGSALKCVGYSFEEGDINGRRVLYVDVSFSTDASEAAEANKPPRGQAVESIGWRSGSVQRDMVKDAITGKMLLNTAGQPFDSVPQIDIPSPVFTKVIKTTTRQSSWLSCYGSVNSGTMSLGGVSCAAHCVRCVQCDEERLWNDEFGFKYKYTCGFQVMKNVASIAGESETDIGWDLAAVSTGTMELKTVGSDEVLVPISVISKETGKEVYVSQPVLLDEDGHAQTDSNAEPYAIRYRPYPAVTFPDAMYSEPL